MQKAPSFFLTAIGAARVIGGPPGRITPLCLLFHGGAGAETAFQINASLRAIYPRVEQLQIASVVNLKHTPSYMRSAYEFDLSLIYQKTAQEIPLFCSPNDYVLILPDWEGKVTQAFAMDNRAYDIGLAVIVPPWQLFGTYIGAEPQKAAIDMVGAAVQYLATPAVDTLESSPIDTR